MKILVGIVVVIAAVAAFWYFGLSYSLDVGISSSEPLGTYEKLEKHLLSKNLRKGDPQPGEVKSLLGDKLEITPDLQATAFVDLVPGLRHQVIVVRRPDGKVAAVCAHFRSGSFEFSKTGTAAENFAALYWTALAGSEPKFSKQMEGGADRREFLLATLRRSGVEGAWRKEGGGSAMLVPHEVTDLATFVRK